MGELNGHFGSLRNMYPIKDIISTVFRTLNGLEDLIAIICPKVLYVFYILSINNHNGIESIADMMRRNKIVFYNQWYNSYHLRNRDDIRN